MGGCAFVTTPRVLGTLITLPKGALERRSPSVVALQFVGGWKMGSRL